MIVQNNIGNRNSSTTIVAPATGTHRGYPFEVLVEADGSPFEKDTSVRLDQIRVVAIEKRLHSVLGSLSEPNMAEVDEAVNYPSLLPRRIRASVLEGSVGPKSHGPCERACGPCAEGALMWTPGDQLSAVGR
ncbi:MAG: type II toxin-antitoxin system PemK/MazF family toxin [Natronomonas sp.]